MLHLLHKRPPGDVEMVASAVPAPPIVITAVPAPAAPPHGHLHWPDAAHLAAMGHIHLPQPRPTYPRREGGYFETSRLSRAMEHL